MHRAREERLVTRAYFPGRIPGWPAARATERKEKEQHKTDRRTKGQRISEQRHMLNRVHAEIPET